MEKRQAKPQADMSFMGRVKDNVIGVDDGVMSAGEKIATALNKGGESLTLGIVGDEAAAAADALVGRGTFDSRLQHHRGNEDQFAKENPALSFASEFAPALIPGAGAAGAVKQLGSVVGRTAAGAAAGAAAGGTFGFMEGEGGVEERKDKGLQAMLVGGLFGATAPRVTDFAASVPRRVSQVFTKSAERPTIPMLKAAKNAAYKAVDDSGEVFSPEDMAGLLGRVKTAFDDGNYVEETDNALRATLSILEKRKDQPATLSQLDNIRKNLWKRYAGAKDQPQILDAIREIDGLVESKAGASELMGIARAANSRFAKSQLLDDAFRKAADQTASAGSGGNLQNKMRQAVTSIINNERKAKFFTGEEIEMMRDFVRGSNGENMRRLIGKASPDGNGLMMVLHATSGVMSGGATLPLAAVGTIAKRSADKATLKHAGEIQDFLAGVAPKALPAPSTGSTLAVGSAPLAENTQALGRNKLIPAR
ncbi:MAG: hypothetical protein ABJ360_22555 [Roseobacter sp.]